MTEKTNKPKTTSSVDEVERAWHFLKPLIVLLGTGLIGQITLYVEGNPTGGVPDGDPEINSRHWICCNEEFAPSLANNPFLNDMRACELYFGSRCVNICRLCCIMGWRFCLAFRLLSCQFSCLLRMVYVLATFARVSAK